MVVGHGPNEGNGEERDIFWNDLDKVVDGVGNVYRLCVLLDFQKRMIMEEEWRSSVLKGECVLVTYFEHRSLHKYTRVARGQGRVEVKSTKYLVMVKKDMLHYVQDVKAMRGMVQSHSDHHVVLLEVGLVGSWIKRRMAVDRARKIINKKLTEHQYRKGYTRSLEVKRVE